MRTPSLRGAQRRGNPVSALDCFASLAMTTSESQALNAQVLTLSLRPLPALNLGWVDSRICIGSPVRGLRPVEALRREQEKVPKPTRRTSSPRLRALLITSNTLSTAREASPL